jgi:hypothetical protein
MAENEYQILYDVVDRISVAQNMVQWRALLDTLYNFWIP